MTIKLLKCRDTNDIVPYAFPNIQKLVHRPNNIPNLPVELITNILSHLEHFNLLQCSQVCKLFYKLVNETSRLLYTIELGKSRMVSLLTPEDNPNFASRLELLRDREQAWRVLGWKHRRILDLPPTGSLYEFVGGVYGNGKEGDNRLTTSISFLELPSLGLPSKTEDVKLPQELQTWTHLMPDLSIIDFTMDPMQDLLVLVAVAPSQSQYVYELHIRSIKTNQPHPKAPVAVLPCLRKPENHLTPIEVITAVRVQVCGDLVALLIKDVMENSGGHLEIWNWEAGPKNSCTMPRTQGIDDFSFITRDVALIVRPTGQFEVYDFTDPRKESSEPVLRYSFAFPPLSPGYSYWYISMSNNPTPGHIPRPEDNTNMDNFLKGHKQIYYPDPKERIHACCLYVFNPADPTLQAVSSFVFFVKIDSLLNPPFEWFDREPYRDDRPHAPYYHPSLFQANRLKPTWWPQSPNTDEEKVTQVKRDRSPSALSGTSGSGSSSEDVSTPSEIDLPVLSFPTDYSSPASSTHDNPSLETQAEAQAQAQADPIVSDDTKHPVPWEVWGPTSTRWFEECLSTDWQHAIYGLRAVESVDVEKMSAERQFHIHTWPVGRNPEDAEAVAAESSTPSAPSGSSTTGVEGVGHTPSHSSGHAAGDTSAGQQGDTSATATNTTTTNTATTGIATATAAHHHHRRGERRFLRIRDFSPYAQTRAARMETKDHAVFKGKGKCRSVWRTPKVVSETSRVAVDGVFKYDIMSSLPYVETVSDETFDVTDVMMDDSRLLLLKRGATGRLKQLEVLML